MNLMMLFAAMGAKTQQTVTFTSNQTWVAPSGVTVLNTVIGKGADSTTTTRNSTVVSVVYHSTGTGVPGSSVAWDSVQGLAESAAADVDDDGAATFTRYTIQAYPDSTNTYTYTSVSISTGIPGSAGASFTGGWDTSGPISSSGTSRVTYDSYTNGASSTGFGKTFPGGVGGAIAPVTSFTNVSVTPGSSYPIVVPTGGTVQITYFA